MVRFDGIQNCQGVHKIIVKKLNLLKEIIEFVKYD